MSIPDSKLDLTFTFKFPHVTNKQEKTDGSDSKLFWSQDKI